MTARPDHDAYQDLVQAVRAKGETFRKEHGEWVRLRLDTTYAGPFLQLDTWNKQLILKRGPGDYNYHGGFGPTRGLEVLGIDFGGFSLYVTPARLATYQRLVRNAPMAVQW